MKEEEKAYLGRSAMAGAGSVGFTMADEFLVSRGVEKAVGCGLARGGHRWGGARRSFAWLEPAMAATMDAGSGRCPRGERKSCRMGRR